ncbi:hypothetical protein Y032_0021g419 [Ancylostoma ceylanicum]|uniref:Uncharacterized protein n=1 Tax=Ancylostoma ceylanicum TaxID=53326 RepID=A0A016V211_9BILA|nr:hypothetical protein Y032_0021g419 [Ancylostoma ceylanicum]
MRARWTAVDEEQANRFGRNVERQNEALAVRREALGGYEVMRNTVKHQGQDTTTCDGTNSIAPINVVTEALSYGGVTNDVIFTPSFGD